MDSRDAALLCAQIAYEKKAEDIVVLDVSKIVVITDYFVIASGGNRKQLQAIADGIHQRLKPDGRKRLGHEGYEEGQWILVDYGDLIVQLFDKEKREYYNLETIWGDAPRVPFTPQAVAPQPPPEQ